MDDDLDQAYARAHALADDGRGPSASVRADVLAAAARIAAGDDAAGRPLVPVAAPVADVGRGRARAINLSSWRVRSGAALCAMLLVGLALWRFDQNGRFSGGEQVAQAELRLAEPQAAPVPRDLPLPAAAAASYPYAAPPAVVEDPLDNGSNARVAAAKKAERDKDVVVAQLEKERSVARRMQPSADAVPPPAAPLVADAVNKPAPVVAASNSPRAEAAPAPAPLEESTTESLKVAAAPPQVATSPPRAPSVLPRRVLLAPKAAPTPAAAAPVDPAAAAGNTAVASVEADSRVADAAEARALSKAAVSNRALPSAAGSLAAASPGPLQAAAGRGDLETLRRLLADPATRVDAPDAAGRTALLDAVLAQQPAAVRLLLEAGADPAHADRAGLTPRAAAQAGANAEIAVLLAAPR